MLRNDYRRALIMLRPHARGMTGHVRLERRTLAGTMRFTVQGAPQGTLHASLMANTGGHWIIYRLGALKNDQRGQSGMTASFDPRNLRGLDLDKYTLIAIVSTANGTSELVMTGMVNGYKDVNWADVTAAATAEFAPRRRASAEANAAVQPVEAGADDLVGADSISAREASGVEAGVVDAVEAEAAKAGIIDPGEFAEEVARADNASAECCCEDAEQAIIEVFDMADDSDIEDEQVYEVAEQVADDVEIVADDAGQAADDVEQSASDTRALAWELLKLDPDISWPSDIEAVRELFERARATDAFKLDDFVFVEAPLPSENGADGICAIGLKSRGGRPVSVCYALPGSYSIEAPPGLEDYMYLGGWWYTVLDVL